MRIAARLAAIVIAIALGAWASPVGAEGFQIFQGNTVGGPFFNRPDSDCGATANNVRYHVQEFVLLDAATCNIYSTQRYDGFIHLYSGGNFDPAAPTANCIDGDDDDNLGRGNSKLEDLELPAGIYSLVTSAFSTSSAFGSEGSFSNTIQCGSSGSSSDVQNARIRHGGCSGQINGVPDDQEICLQNDLFLVAIDNISGPAPGGLGTPVRTGSTDTGIFWFYNDRNWEVMVKVLNGCAINGHYWVFAGALTDQRYRINVFRNSDGALKTYSNQLGTRSRAFADTAAFPCPP
jgi:hypothetical protein